jgi:hypothetical protein
VSARLWLRVTSAAAAVALSSLARADAPPDQYDLFNVNSDVIQDLYTDLYWQRYASSTPVPWARSFAVCESLSLGKYPNGWRVPSYKELLTLVDEAPHTEYESGALVQKAIDPNAFPGTTVDTPYWTSSMPASQPTNAYAVNFHTGVPQLQDALTSFYVRCVHDPPPGG